MEQAEPPECPVCLQPYDAVSVIPRVLSCGHTTCEACLKQLPKPFPNSIRCTVCTLLMKIPNGPSSLPKNLDLLHFSFFLNRSNQDKDEKPISPPRSHALKSEKEQALSSPFIPKSWSNEFHRKWKKWILPEDCILVEKIDPENDSGVVCGKVLKSSQNDSLTGCVLKEKEQVGLVKVGIFMEGEGSKFFKCSYDSRILSVLSGMKENEIDELGTILNVNFRVSNIGNVYGFWYNDKDMCVYMVCEKFDLPNVVECMLKKKDDQEGRLHIDEMGIFGMLSMEICETLSRLHSEGLVFGYLGLSYFCFSGFGRVYIDISEVLNTVGRVNKAVRLGDKDLEVGLKNLILDENLVFISPEMLLQVLGKEGFELEQGKSIYEAAHASDVWSLGCVLVWLIVGNSFVEEIKILLRFLTDATRNEKGCDISGYYIDWKERIVSLLGDRLDLECVSIQEILCRCLKFDPGDRPLITELWQCLRELVIRPQYDMRAHLKSEVEEKKPGLCLVLGKLWQRFEETKQVLADGLQGKVKSDKADKDVVDGVSTGHVKCTEMKGHLGCVTGLAIGGGYLFSSSFDKIVHVWSLQDFTCVHSFKGHEHRVMAVVFVDGEEHLCISGDNEGVICIWEAIFPFTDVPVKKLYEEKDWRYSGIHAMAVSGTEYLYTGSGDKLVKAWSLQDYSLSCAMSGRKSVVSSLVVQNGVLYSGSWDGTVRLWSLSDHSPLTVLGEDKLGNMNSILSLSADHDLLVVGHENGSIKIWNNDVILKSIQAHKGAVFSVSKNSKWLFSGGLDKTINVQEISEDGDAGDTMPIGTIACYSTITALAYWRGKLFVGQADRIIKVYHGT